MGQRRFQVQMKRQFLYALCKQFRRTAAQLEDNRSRDTKMSEKHFAKEMLLLFAVMAERRTHIAQGKALHILHPCLPCYKRDKCGKDWCNRVACCTCERITISCGSRRRIGCTTRGKNHGVCRKT